jgi:hypothetical protein
MHSSSPLFMPETSVDASKKVGVKVNTEKSKYTLLSHHQNAGQNHDIKITNRCFENVVQFRYLETTVTNKNFIQEEIERRLNSCNASYRLVQNLLSSHLQSKNIKIRIYNIIILPVILYGYETWSLTLREEP